LQTARRARTLIPEGSLPLIMSRADSVDIDSQADLLLAEQSLVARRFTKSASSSQDL
jgi:CMP-N-acetylneuraminic acid synthetase